ncbi:efflux transporter outer membrane subunit [Paraburkholderia lycopersici]|uniref:Efflux transporter, outer membrane factor (OMF) lipoprotein, NodT family n=1 Tax=Paraburkholderia lycopersici TaxID=416944 RepID=A0A1G6QVK9_9BURK|nr:TolC family protein [Paraburkholderia lycopersici]SDC96341.1 efflux transporter, outer membrane factor (OMF) lipoprotein, NodT family [Paraburkholderia lycopersici]
MNRTSVPMRPARLASILPIVLAVAACTSLVEVPVPPQRDVPAAFTEVPVAGALAAPDLAHWWRAWQDPGLTGYVEQALLANTDLRIAQARVREARALATVAQSARYPTLSAQAGAAHAFGDLREPAIAPDHSPDLDAYAGGVTAAWEADLFGGRASDAQAASALADAAQEKLRGTRIAIAADVAQNYLEARGLQRRLAVLERSLDTLHAMERYAAARFDAGQAPRADVERVSERIAQREAERGGLVSQIEVRERRLAVLSGKPAQEAERLAPPGPLRLPAPPSGEVPSGVLERRPDVRASAALVRAAAARLGSAKADLLPRFYLTFVGLDGHLRLDGLPGLGGTGGLVGIGADLPLFNAGRLRANVDANDARLQAALALHDKTLLQTLEEVDSAYGVRWGLDQRRAQLAAAHELAMRHAAQVQQLYEGGQRTLQDVLDARVDTIAREDELEASSTAAALATVRLYLALGGGWSADDTAPLNANASP